MKSKVTVPLIVKDEEPWLDQCIESIGNTAIVKKFPYVEGNIGIARRQAWENIKTPYIAIVDPDDYLEPGIITECVEILEKTDHLMVYTNEAIVDVNGKILEVRTPRAPYLAHHLSVVRTEAIKDFLPEMEKYPMRNEAALKAWLLQKGTFFHLDKVGYYWRQHPNQSIRDKKSEQIIKGKYNYRKLLEEYGFRRKLEVKRLSKEAMSKSVLRNIIGRQT